MMDLTEYLTFLVQNEGSDLFLTSNSPAIGRFHGVMKAVENDYLSHERVQEIAFSLMDAEQRKAFEQTPELNLALEKPGIGRFRINFFKQRGKMTLVIRNIKLEIPKPEDLGMPDVLKKLILEKRGLMLFVGATGSGKSTSLASLIDYRNRHAAGHIITIEDPIEYIHPHRLSLVHQREVGIDTLSYNDALKNTLRQSPDVILIGEIRSQDTMEHALAFAETGHLCLSTLHANNANQAIDRIINFFPEDRRNQLLLDLSLNVKAIVSQRLVPNLEGKRTAAFEILLSTQLVRDLILKGEVHILKETMEKSENLGMQTFDGHLLRLFKAGIISLEEALHNSDSPTNLKLKIKLSDGNDLINTSSLFHATRNTPNSNLSLHAMQEKDDDDD